MEEGAEAGQSNEQDNSSKVRAQSVARFEGGRGSHKPRDASCFLETLRGKEMYPPGASRRNVALRTPRLWSVQTPVGLLMDRTAQSHTSVYSKLSSAAKQWGLGTAVRECTHTLGLWQPGVWCSGCRPLGWQPHGIACEVRTWVSGDAHELPWACVCPLLCLDLISRLWQNPKSLPWS